jgi:hypothetical protein
LKIPVRNKKPPEGGFFLVVDFTDKENRHLEPVRAWAESIAMARQSLRSTEPNPRRCLGAMVSQRP